MPRQPGRLFSLLMGLGFAVALIGAAHADEATDRARALFKRAEMHFSLGEFEKARELYSAAYRAKQLPELLFNIGQAYWQLGDCKKVAFYYQQFLLRKAVGPAQRAQIERLQRTCKPKPVAVTQPATTPATQPATKPAMRPMVATSGPTSRVATSQPARKDPVVVTRRISRLWFWVALGTTTALLTASAITGVVARNKNDAYLDPSTTIARREELRSAGRALETTSWSLLGAGGALAVGTVVLYVLSQPRESKAPTIARVAAAPLTGGALVVWRGSF